MIYLLVCCLSGRGVGPGHAVLEAAWRGVRSTQAPVPMPPSSRRAPVAEAEEGPLWTCPMARKLQRAGSPAPGEERAFASGRWEVEGTVQGALPGGYQGGRRHGPAVPSRGMAPSPVKWGSDP